jgi:cyanophycinase-like exopeptidase
MSDSREALYLIAGGRGIARPRGPDPLLQAVVRQAGVSRPRVAYVGAASGDNPAFRLLVGRMLEKAGAGDVTLAPLCGRRADVEKARAVLEAADLVFISGGDVEEGMRVLQSRDMLPFLRKMLRAGKPFFGVSAGSIMLARTWVRWTDPKNDDSAERFPCMGFAPVLCDTHSEGDGWSELKALLALSPVGAAGYGIVSGTALVVGSDGAVGALGGEVHVFRRRKAGVVQVASLRPGEV